MSGADVLCAAQGIPEVGFDPAGYAADRAAYWESLRQLGPIVRMNGAYCLTRRKDMLDALRHPGLSAKLTPTRAVSTLGRRMVDHMVPLVCQPPEHTQIRRILQPFFAPRALGDLLPSLQTQAAVLVDGAFRMGRCEAMRDVAVAFPAQALLTLLGLPLRERDTLLKLRDGVNAGVRSPRQVRSGAPLESELVAYLGKAIVDSRRRRPGMLRQLLDSGELTTEQVLGFLWLMVFAGIETVTVAIGFALMELATRPQLRSMLREHPDQIDAFVDEVVRLHAPLTMANRVATEEVTVAGVTLPAGSMVTALLDAANFEKDSATEMSVTGDGKITCRQWHLGYGGGIHRCLGEHLAKIELQLIVSEWLRRIPEFELAPNFAPRFVFCNGSVRLAALPLRWRHHP